MERTAFEAHEKDAGIASGLPRGDSESTSLTSIWRVHQDRSHQADDLLAVEDPLEIQIVFGPHRARQRKSITVTMRTPGRDAELAAGFLLTEGVLDDSAQILRIDTAENTVPTGDVMRSASGVSNENTVRVELAPDVDVRMATLERNFYTTSSCGICGKASLLALRSVCPPRYSNHVSVDAEVLYALPQLLRESQAVFDATGGLHGAALFTTEGQLILSREDVGRHNAVDKLLGHQFLADAVPLRDQILMLSGRVSFELMQKAVMAGIPVVVAVGAPSSLAVKVAEDFDVTLVGFLRDQRFNIYHGRDRIRGLSSLEAMQ